MWRTHLRQPVCIYLNMDTHSGLARRQYEGKLQTTSGACVCVCSLTNSMWICAYMRLVWFLLCDCRRGCVCVSRCSWNSSVHRGLSTWMDKSGAVQCCSPAELKETCLLYALLITLITDVNMSSVYRLEVRLCDPSKIYLCRIYGALGRSEDFMLSLYIKLIDQQPKLHSFSCQWLLQS